MKIKGYMSKTIYKKLAKNLEQPSFVILYKTKGTEEDWGESHWPPVKVEVTIRKAK